MPSIQSAIDLNIARITAGGTTGATSGGTERVEGPNINAPSGLLTPVVTGLPVRGTYPPNLTLHTDFQNNTQGFRIGPNMRSAMFPTPANPSTTTIKVTSVSGSGGGGGVAEPSLLLETNNTANGVQNTLNLLNGTNISIVTDNSGNVTVNDIFPDPATVAHGGTGLTTLTAHNVLIGEGTSNVAFASPNTGGFVLTSNGASSDPSFQALPATPLIVYTATVPARATAITDTTMVTVGGTSLLYRFTGELNCTTTSAAATATLNLKWTDTGSQAQQFSVTSTCTTLGSSSIADMVHGIRAKTGTTITYGVTIANTPTFDVDVRLETL